MTFKPPSPRAKAAAMGMHSFRCSNEDWRSLEAIARRHDCAVSDVLRAAVNTYVIDYVVYRLDAGLAQDGRIAS